MGVSVVLFDLGGVLEVGDLIDRGGQPQWLLDLGARLGLSAAQLRERMASVDPHGLITTGGLTESQWLHRHQQALGFGDDEISGFRSHFWDWYCGEPDEELFGYARALSRRCRLGVLSNSADGAREQEECRYGLSALFDPVVYSHEIGLAKPDPAAFRRAAELAGAPPGRIAFVDDHRENVDAAARVGMHAVHHLSTPTTISRLDRLLGGPAGGDAEPVRARRA